MSSRLFECIEHTAPSQHIRQYPRATSTTQEQRLQLCVKQYRPRERQTSSDVPSVTLLAAPALSCAKELYEPIWDALHEYSCRDDAHFRIRSIWSVDFAIQGASGVRNERLLGDEPSMFDSARDLLLLVNEFRDDMPRPIIGFGHSLGATVLLNLSLLHPRLLTSLVLVEPAVSPDPKRVSFDLVYPMAYRKDKWKSREAAVRAHLKSPMYANWDPRVLELFRQHAFRDLPTAIYPDQPSADGDTVTLTSTKHQEVLSYARPAYPADRHAAPETFAPPHSEDPEYKWTSDPSAPFYRPENLLSFSWLPSIRPSCFFVYGAASHWRKQSGTRGRPEELKVTGTGVGGNGGIVKGMVKDWECPGGSHYVPMEQPDAIGVEFGAWLSGEMRTWQANERRLVEAQTAIPQKERSMLSGDYLYWAQKTRSITKPPGSPATPKKDAKL